MPRSENLKAPPLIFVTPRYGRAALGGLGISAERIVGHLASAHPVKVITPLDSLPVFTRSDYTADGIEITEVGLGRGDKEFLQFFADVVDTVARKESAPEFLGFYCNELAYATTLVASRHGRAPWLFARGNDIDLEPFGPAAFQVHYALTHARRVFCVTRELVEKVRAFCPKARPHWLPNGVDPGWFPLRPRPHESGLVKVGLFGDIKQKKGLGVLLSALDFHRFELRIGGHLREEAARLLHGFLDLRPEFRQRIEVLPYVSDVSVLLGYYESVDIVCVPSLHEGLSNAMLEAMCCGKACVCSAVGGAPDVIEDGVNGFLFEAGSAEALAGALDRAVDHLGRDAIGLGRAARATVMGNFSVKKERRRYLRALATAS